jgi:homoserine kinase
MSERVSVRVPATCANLGCLFDCGAIALSLYANIHAALRVDDEIVVRYSGIHGERVRPGPKNLIARTLQETLRSWGKTRGFELEIENQIPVGVGVGSSAAAIVGALAAAHVLADRAMFDEELVSVAAQREGHPDNVAAAWHGVPDYALPTEEARKVLPGQYSRPDAIHNLQRAAMLTAQLFSGRAELHRAFFDDRWHQSYRSPLVPGLSEVLALEHPDLLGVCLSGSGPSILAFARQNSGTIGELIQNTLAKKQVRVRIYVLAADNRGAKGWSLPV